ncbi:MAG: hypothetical protein KDA92_13825, partial [Planctomycetales bacterium]|nr:hypothetical protein [Planctomycetales bacterium]
MKKLEHELDVFRHRLVDMANLTEKMVRHVVGALEDPQGNANIKSIIEDEDRLDLMQLQIDKEA